MFGKRKINKEFIDETLNLIKELHESIITNSGGMHGIRDEGGLYNSIYKILLHIEKNNENPVSIAAFVYRELARRHHFNDGNKRTSHVFAKIVLFSKGFHLQIEYKEAVLFIVEIAKHKSTVSKEEIEKWVEENMISLVEKYLENYINETILEISEHERKQN